MSGPSDYRLGLERAAHECEWMARGYAAYLMQPLLDAAKRIREIPDDPADEPHCKRRDSVRPAPPSTLVQTAAPTFNETGDALKVERLRKLAADLERFASAIYADYSQSDLWSTLCAARVAVLATLTKDASHD